MPIQPHYIRPALAAYPRSLAAAFAGFTPFEGIFFGFLAALSSTAIVLKGLAERGETDAPHGRLIVLASCRACSRSCEVHRKG